jgi:hypothetical protein
VWMTFFDKMINNQSKLNWRYLKRF